MRRLDHQIAVSHATQKGLVAATGCASVCLWRAGSVRTYERGTRRPPRPSHDAADYFQPQAIAKLLDAHCRAEADHAKYLWDLLMLDLWQRTSIDGEGLTVTVATKTQTAATTSGSPLPVL